MFTLMIDLFWPINLGLDDDGATEEVVCPGPVTGGRWRVSRPVETWSDRPGPCEGSQGGRGRAPGPLRGINYII